MKRFFFYEKDLKIEAVSDYSDRYQKSESQRFSESVPGGGSLSSFLSKQNTFFYFVVIKKHSTLVSCITIFTFIPIKYQKDNV